MPHRGLVQSHPPRRQCHWWSAKHSPQRRQNQQCGKLVLAILSKKSRVPRIEITWNIPTATSWCPARSYQLGLALFRYNLKPQPYQLSAEKNHLTSIAFLIPVVSYLYCSSAVVLVLVLVAETECLSRPSSSSGSLSWWTSVSSHKKRSRGLWNLRDTRRYEKRSKVYSKLQQAHARTYIYIYIAIQVSKRGKHTEVHDGNR